MKSEKRWLEIRFVYLCFTLYDNLKDYILTANYIEFLADIAGMERATALRLLQKVNQINCLRPTTAEYVCIARQNKETIKNIMTALNISKGRYIEYTHKCDMSADYPAFSTNEELELMQRLLDAHKKLKGAGL